MKRCKVSLDDPLGNNEEGLDSPVWTHCCSVHPAHLHAPGASLQTPPSDESPVDGAAGTGDSSVSMEAGASADGVIVSAGCACCSSCVSSGAAVTSDDEGVDEDEGAAAELADVFTGITTASHCVLDEKAPFLLWLLATTSRLDVDELATQDDELDQGAADIAGFSSSCSFSVDEGLGSGVHDEEEVVGAMYSDDGEEEDGAGPSSSLPLLSTGSPFRFQICLLVISPIRRKDNHVSFRKALLE